VASSALDRLKTRGNTEASLKFPSNLGSNDSKYYTWFKIYETTPSEMPKLDFLLGPGGPNLSTITLTRPFNPKAINIALYMPASITNVQNAAYGNVEMGNIIAGMQAFNRTDTGEVGSAAGGALDFLKTIGEQRLKQGGAEARSLIGAYEIESGRVLNNRTELIFENIDRRTFTFDFKMIPRTEDEAVSIQKIVKEFRRHMVPKIDDKAITNRTMIVPSLFEVEFKPNTSGYLPKIGKSVCTSCNVTYGGARPQFYNDGSPVETSMTITLQEIELITQSRVDEGY